MGMTMKKMNCFWVLPKDHEKTAAMGGGYSVRNEIGKGSKPTLRTQNEREEPTAI